MSDAQAKAYMALMFEISKAKLYSWESAPIERAAQALLETYDPPENTGRSTLGQRDCADSVLAPEPSASLVARPDPLRVAELVREACAKIAETCLNTIGDTPGRTEVMSAQRIIAHQLRSLDLAALLEGSK